jgi:hypothetical protein
MKVKDILDKPERWTQGAAARDKRGRRCDVISDAAVRFCLRGAAARVYSGPALEDALFSIAKALNLDEECYEDLDGAIEVWNDDPDRTFAEVRQVVERAGV